MLKPSSEHMLPALLNSLVTENLVTIIIFANITDVVVVKFEPASNPTIRHHYKGSS